MANKILIVDDDEMILTCFSRLLGRRFEIETAQGSKQALEMIATRGPYAVVLSDMRMPVLSGMDLIARVKAMSPESICILLSGNADSDETQGAIRKGILFRVVEKPCPPDEIIQNLEDALALHRQFLQRLTA